MRLHLAHAIYLLFHTPPQRQAVLDPFLGQKCAAGKNVTDWSRLGGTFRRITVVILYTPHYGLSHSQEFVIQVVKPTDLFWV